MSEEKYYTKKEVQEIIDNMIEAISASELFMHRLLMADMIEESRILKRQTECCFRVLGAVANLDELLKYDEPQKEESFSLSEFVTDIVDNCRAKTRNHLAKISLERIDSAFIRCSKDRLYACVMNLLVNALQEIDPDEGHIKVSIRSGEDYSTLTISDNGYGLSGVDLSEYTKKGATGGLAVVSRFCESVGTTPLFETSENGGFSATIKIPNAPYKAEFHATQSGPMLGLFSPVNIYLAKIKRFDVTNLYKNY